MKHEVNEIEMVCETSNAMAATQRHIHVPGLVLPPLTTLRSHSCGPYPRRKL